MPQPDPEPEVLEVKPGVNVFMGRKVVLKMRVCRNSVWSDVPDEAGK